jgi:hypothetical protein
LNCQQKIVEYAMTTDWQQIINEKSLKFKFLIVSAFPCKFNILFVSGTGSKINSSTLWPFLEESVKNPAVDLSGHQCCQLPANFFGQINQKLQPLVFLGSYFCVFRPKFWIVGNTVGHWQLNAATYTLCSQNICQLTLLIHT